MIRPSSMSVAGLRLSVLASVSASEPYWSTISPGAGAVGDGTGAHVAPTTITVTGEDGRIPIVRRVRGIVRVRSSGRIVRDIAGTGVIVPMVIVRRVRETARDGIIVPTALAIDREEIALGARQFS